MAFDAQEAIHDSIKYHKNFDHNKSPNFQAYIYDFLFQVPHGSGSTS